jgi:DNA polymerase-4
LAVGKVNGIGPKSVPRLNAQGIHTVGDLARVGLAALVGHLGARYGAWLWDVARGHDERPLVTERDPKSMSRERTFARDLHPRQDREALSEILLALCKQVSADLERKGLAARTVSIKLRYADFRTVSRDHTLPAPTADAQQIRAAARTCLRRVPLDQRIRLLGVRAAGLAARGANADAHPEPEALPLFAE